MKSKIITISQRNNAINGNLNNKNLTSESRNETEKKIQMLTDKLANHFKTKLSFLFAEKNYQFSDMIRHIGLFVRNLENSNYEIESVIPRLESYLLDIFVKQQPATAYNSRHISENISKSHKINKTESNNNNDNDINNINYTDYQHEDYIKSLPNSSSKANKNNRVFSNMNANSNNKIILKENSVFASNSSSQNNNNINTKLNSLTKTHSKKTLSTNLISNNSKNTQQKNESLNKDALLNRLNTNNNTESNIINIIDYSEKEGKNLVKKTEKLNDLKVKAMDEWALIAKYNYLKHLEEQDNKRNFEEEKKRKVREILDNQMKEKDLLRKLKEEEDMKFFKMQSDKISDLEKDYMEKEKMKAEKIKMQKELQEKFIKGNCLIVFN